MVIWICSILGGYGTLSSVLLTDYHHNSVIYIVKSSLVCVDVRGSISRSSQTQGIKMGSCVLQCDIPHQWIAQRQAVYVYCDGWSVMSCVYVMAFLCGSALVKVPLLQAGTVAKGPQMFRRRQKHKK